MTKLIGCTYCGDVVLADVLAAVPDSPTSTMRTCRCGMTRGFFLTDRHHVAIIGPGVALGLFNNDLTEAVQSDKESGYWPIRLWRIPDGDRIIVITNTGTVVAPCTRCKPFCRYLEWAEKEAERLWAWTRTRGVARPKDDLSGRPSWVTPIARATPHPPVAKQPAKKRGQRRLAR